MIQSVLKTVDVVEVVFPFLADGSLKTFPVHYSVHVNPADLICFEVSESFDGSPCGDYVYAIVESVVRRQIAQMGHSTRRFDLIKFRVLSDLSDIVLS